MSINNFQVSLCQRNCHIFNTDGLVLLVCLLLVKFVRKLILLKYNNRFLLLSVAFYISIGVEWYFMMAWECDAVNNHGLGLGVHLHHIHMLVVHLWPFAILYLSVVLLTRGRISALAPYK